MEFWAQVEDFPNYQVSSMGRVRSCVTRTNTWFGKILRTYIDKNGYLKLSLFRDGKKFPRYSHKLVANAFVANPLGLPEVNHKDGVRTNPDMFNLEWRTGNGNKRYAVKTGQNGAKGISYWPRDNKWRAHCKGSPLANKWGYLGTFSTREAALAARKLAVEGLFDVN